MNSSWDFFVSYSWKDNDNVIHIIQKLEEYGFRPWVDKERVERRERNLEAALTEGLVEGNVFPDYL